LIGGDSALLEGDEILVAEGIRTVAADCGDAALEELRPRAVRDEVLAHVDRRRRQIALCGESEAVRDQLGVFRRQRALSSVSATM
jgi:hypothetical protein